MLEWLNDSIAVLPSAVNIGVVKLENNFSGYLIDTGIDNSAINKALKNIPFSIKGAIITHHHADHMGGASKLSQLGITNLYGPENELDFFENPRNGIPYSMFGGGSPPKILRNRFLEAKPCKISPVNENQFNSDIKIIETPGHSLGHVAFVIHEVLFAGDSVFTETTIEKYNLLFVVDPNKAISSLENLEREKFSAMVPGHGNPTKDRKSSLENLKVTKDHYIKTKNTFLEEVLTETLIYDKLMEKSIKVFDLKHSIKSRGVSQYFLFQTSILAYLSNLLDEKKVKLEIEGRKLQIVSN